MGSSLEEFLSEFSKREVDKDDLVNNKGNNEAVNKDAVVLQPSSTDNLATLDKKDDNKDKTTKIKISPPKKTKSLKLTIGKPKQEPVVNIKQPTVASAGSSVNNKPVTADKTVEYKPEADKTKVTFATDNTLPRDKVIGNSKASSIIHALESNESEDIGVNNDESIDSLIDYLFEHSESDISVKDEWIDMYKSAKASSKNNIIVNKMRKGRFMIDKEKKVILLPDDDMYNMSSKEMLNRKYNVSGD